jgi:hypothetical protein
MIDTVSMTAPQLVAIHSDREGQNISRASDSAVADAGKRAAGNE